MGLFTSGKVWISADRASYLLYEAGTLSLVVDGTTVWSATAAAGAVFGAGAQIGNEATDLVGFYGATPVAQPAATAQSAVGTTAITTLATTPTATDIAVAVNSLISRVAALTTLANQIRSDNVTLGLLKGSN